MTVIHKLLLWQVFLLLTLRLFFFKNQSKKQNDIKYAYRNESRTFFCSPEPKAQVSFSDQNLSVGIVVVVNFSHFHLLLQNYWANFNQTWHKASLGIEDSCLVKWRALPFSNSENTLTKLPEQLYQFNKTWHNASLSEGYSKLFKWRTQSFSKGR